MTRQAVFTILKQQAKALSTLLHPFCEVVVHDFADINHTIVCIEGNITGRSTGGPPTDLLLSRVKNREMEDDLANYLTSLPGGRLMKSSTVFVRDENGEAYGAFCVNFDLSLFIAFHNDLSKFVLSDKNSNVSELFSDDIRDTVHTMITDTLYEMGGSGSDMTRDEKVELINRLHNKGVFQVKKAVPIIADLLSLSRATVYNYLREANDGL